MIIGSILILVSAYLILIKLRAYEDYGDKTAVEWEERIAAYYEAQQAEQAQEEEPAQLTV